MEKSIQMTSHQPPSLLVTPQPSSFFRSLSFAFLAGAALLAGCTTAPRTFTTASEPAPGKVAVAPPTEAAAPAKTQTDSSAAAIMLGEPLLPLTPAQVGGFKTTAVEPPKELWDRIRRGFAMPDLQDPLVGDREQWYSSRPDYIQRMTGRSSKYLFHIVEELERRKMPTELALLPFIESAFNPQAVSSAKAAGMWQFMPATGKYFSLKQNAFKDDRRDVLASTRAALDYLQKLHGMFGDWHLALAAYNWGEGSVGRAIERNKKAGLGIGYLDLNMPAETRMYVPKLQAVKNIVANPQGFQAELPVIGNHPYFQRVQLVRDIDVALAARLADVKIDDFKALNPSANRPVIIASGTPEILLPWDNAVVFQRNFEGHAKGQFASWTAWTAPSTISVSDASRRVGMTESELRAANNIPPRMLIKAGSTLLVTRSSNNQSDVSSSVADNAQVSLAPEIVLRRTTVKARKGETVTSMAKRYGLSTSSVAEWNQGIKDGAFKAGQQVVLFLPVKALQRSATIGRGGAKAQASGASKTVSKSTSNATVKAVSRSSKVVTKSKKR
jgi:membrane-bound lytic murein transglycosylase D